VSDEQTQQTTDDPSGPGWRDVGPDEILQVGDMFDNRGRWERTGNPGITADEGRGGTYRRRIEPQQPSDSEPETMDDLRRRLAECEVLLAEADRGGQQVNAELQQLREQLQTLTRERDRYRNQLAGAIEHSKAPEAQALPTKTQELETKTQELETKTQELPAEYTPPEGWRVVRFGEQLLPGDVWVNEDGTERRSAILHWDASAVSGGRCIRRIKPQPQPESDTELQAQVTFLKNREVTLGTRLQQEREVTTRLRGELESVQNLLGTERQRVTQLEELVASLRAINEAQEKAFEAAGKENTDLQHRLNVVATEWAEQAETIRRLQIELDAAQQVPQAIADRFEEGWNQGTARAVETIAEWLEPIRAVDNEHLANETLQHLPQIMRSLTGLAQD
jgi:predicted RNase H-like nuclease (RuvC/YqgF family)